MPVDLANGPLCCVLLNPSPPAQTLESTAAVLVKKTATPSFHAVGSRYLSRRGSSEVHTISRGVRVSSQSISMGADATAAARGAAGGRGARRGSLAARVDERAVLGEHVVVHVLEHPHVAAEETSRA